MGITDQITDLLAANADKTAEELQAYFDDEDNLTGSIVLQKNRRRAVKFKLRTEQQAIANSVVSTKDFPKAICDYGEDGHGRFAKVYYNGKAEIKED